MAGQPPPDYQPGQLLPDTKYKVVKELGAGGMGVVYHVVKPPQIQGVLKLMTPELAGHEEFRRRFLDEVHVLAELDHPNIVKVFDYDTIRDGTPFYVMELLMGRTVRDVLATIGRVPPRVAFEITRQLCEALHCAHTHAPSVVHRDIKPENIFLHAPRHADPVVKLIDFGVVAIADRAHDGAFVGTWKYAAPEQIRGDRATPATDLYAVGLVLYEMLTGVGPFDHVDTGQFISHAHLREPPPLSKLAPWVPRSIVELVSSALAKDPRERPRDAYAFAERLFELEWASDGQDPRDETAEGPLAGVLSSVSAAKPAAPAAPVPLDLTPIAAPKRPKATIPGVGAAHDDDPPPGEDDLLAALVARPDLQHPSKRSSPRGTPPPPHVVIRPSGQRAVARDAVTKEAGTSDADTFSSQQSEARRLPVSRAPIVLAAVAGGLLAMLGLAEFAALRMRTSAKEAEGAAAVSEAASAVAAAPASVAVAASASASASASATAPASAPASASALPRALAAPRAATPRASAAQPAPTAKKPQGDNGYVRSLD